METYTKRPDILERPVGDEHMLYDATGRKVHVLNETAYFIWMLCDGKHDTEAIVTAAAQAFETTPEAVRPDIDACLDAFKQLGVI